MRYRFRGEIGGFGTTSGYRAVVGRWPSSPFGALADVMLERPDGHRLLLAPTAALAEFIAATYTFDEVAVVPVTATRTPARLEVAAGDFHADVTVGRRDGLGVLMRLVPRRLGEMPAWAAAVDPVARRLMAGVRTRGSAGSGRREWYGAHDLHRLVAVRASWQGEDLGSLAPVDPPVRFGFGSAPRRPSLVAVTTTVEVP